MDNYKIKIKDEAESKEAQELFFALGYGWTSDCKQQVYTNQDAITEGYSSDYQIGFIYADDDGCLLHDENDQSAHVTYVDSRAAKELTISTLKDLVVLHRNDINDANYSILVASDIPDYPLFKSSEGIFYSFAENPQKWVECKTINDKTTGVRKLKKDQTSDSSSEFKTIKVEGLEGLIDGKAALAAALNGEEIQMTLEPWESSWQSFNPELEEASTKAFWTDHDSEGRKVFFRIKPNNFLINGMEVPAPLAKEPMGKIPYFYLRPDWEKGYCQTTWEDIPIDRKRFSNGIWATESEIRQVVAAFRKSIQELSNA